MIIRYKYLLFRYFFNSITIADLSTLVL
jgi:hypothetical protein